jgi:NAD(P)-dependent dehydrogenase (short-subunit alcohol dehydrogenase family)
MKLKGKVAIVTGSSQGIGRAVSLALAEAGANVAVNCDRSVGRGDEVAREIQSMGRQAMLVQADVSNADDVYRLVDSTESTLGPVDILVNNAGIHVVGPIEELAEADWDRVMNVNLKGVFLCSQAVGKRMIKRGTGGAIVNIASISAFMPELYLGAYTPSKAGVLGLTRLLAVEWARHNIRVNALCPGPTMTALQRSAYDTEELLAARNSAVPMNRHAMPEEIAKVAVFLASDDSSYITGENIAADGGSLISMFYLVRQLATQAGAQVA